MSGTETRCECGHVHSANGECYGCDCEDFRPTPPVPSGTETRCELPAHIDAVRRALMRRWANRMRGRYGVPVYLVGSALREDNPDPRDWDFRLMLSDEDFAIRFGPVTEWNHQGNTGEWGRTRFRWSDQCVKDTKDAWKWMHLNADVQINPESHAAVHFADQPRVRIDSFPDDAPDEPRSMYDRCGDCDAMRCNHFTNDHAFVESAPTPPAPAVPAPTPQDDALNIVDRFLGYGARVRLTEWEAHIIRDELARLRALASSSSAIREAAVRILSLYDAGGNLKHPDSPAIAALREALYPAALSSSGASPTDTNPRD